MHNLSVKTTLIESFYRKVPVFKGLVLVTLLLFSSYSLAENPVIGKVVFSEGKSTVKQKGQGSKKLKVDDEVSLTDLLKTVGDSTLIVSFIDGAKVTLRPNTILYVKQYSNVQAKISLVNGGIRVVTGDIAKRNPELFKVITPDGVVTAKNKESDFSVRICTQDCDEENKKLTGSDIRTSKPPVAKVVALKGKVEVANKNKRQLAVGNPVFNAEKLVSSEDSYAQLQFIDGSSVSIQAKSAVRINNFKYSKTGKDDRSVFSLIEGGLRFVTGLLGKKDKKAFRLNTSVATIGIRGTDFSVNCVGDCGEGGIVTYVEKGSISQKNETGTYITRKGEYTMIASRTSKPVTTSGEPPVKFDYNIAPDPSESQVNTKSLFSTSLDSGTTIEPGTHVAVGSGQVSVVGPDDAPPVLVGENLAVSVQPSGSVSSVGSLNSFQTLDPVFASFASAPDPDINTIVIGGSSGTNSISGTGEVATVVLQEMTITSPY